MRENRQEKLEQIIGSMVTLHLYTTEAEWDEALEELTLVLIRLGGLRVLHELSKLLRGMKYDVDKAEWKDFCEKNKQALELIHERMYGKGV